MRAVGPAPPWTTPRPQPTFSTGLRASTSRPTRINRLAARSAKPERDRYGRLVIFPDDLHDAAEILVREGVPKRDHIEPAKPAHQPSGTSSSPGSAKAVVPRAWPAADIASR
jgi:hypothetical protein